MSMSMYKPHCPPDEDGYKNTLLKTPVFLKSRLVDTFQMSFKKSCGLLTYYKTEKITILRNNYDS